MRQIDATVESLKDRRREFLNDRIREAYPTEEEFRIINRGIADPQDPEYLEYRAAVEQMVDEYRSIVSNEL